MKTLAGTAFLKARAYKRREGMQLHYQYTKLAEFKRGRRNVHLHEVLIIEFLFLAFHAQSCTFIRPGWNSAHLELHALSSLIYTPSVYEKQLYSKAPRFICMIHRAYIAGNRNLPRKTMHLSIGCSPNGVCLWRFHCTCVHASQ